MVVLYVVFFSSCKKREEKKTHLSPHVLRRRRMWCLFPASCPRYAGKLSHPWESSTHYRNGMISCISDRRCPNSCSLSPPGTKSWDFSKPSTRFCWPACNPESSLSCWVGSSSSLSRDHSLLDVGWTHAFVQLAFPLCMCLDLHWDFCVHAVFIGT